MNRQRFSRRAWPSAEVPFRPPGHLPHAPGAARPVRPPVNPLSRRQLLRTTAGAGLALGAGLLPPGRAYADGGDPVLPNPIPFSQNLPPATRKYGPFHFMLPGPADQGHEPSLITDFNGFNGVAMFAGTGQDGAGNPLTFSGDMRFMKGTYVGVDAKNHRGAFSFI